MSDWFDEKVAFQARRKQLVERLEKDIAKVVKRYLKHFRAALAHHPEEEQ